LLLQHAARGCLSILGVAVHPLGRFCRPLLAHLRVSERQERGLILVLPGIDGESFINHSIVHGLVDGGIQSAIEIYDWTTGFILLFIYHLRASRRHAAQAKLIADRIVRYKRAYPGRPVQIIGHSGGAGMAVLAVESLPDGVAVDTLILLQGALSPEFNLTRTLSRSEHGIVNFYSHLDILFLGVGTLLAGTIDGRPSPAAGMIGFRPPRGLSYVDRRLYQDKFRQVPFRATMARDFNFGGHMGATNRVFIARHVVPLLQMSTTRQLT
jgi:pimeloyl-ACP methyl ester carboxylesterase